MEEHAALPTTPAAAVSARQRRAPRLWILRLVLPPLDRLFNFLGPRYRAFIWLVLSVPPRVLAGIARWRAVRAAADAYRRVHAESAQPVVELYALGGGPFAADAAKIKQTRIIKVVSR